ncbi:MAG: amidohydrolase family protein, partial [Roseibium sp.]|nr:amidohydrolase family protein [Roseibium sp.]
MRDFHSILDTSEYCLAPEVLLTPEGAKRDWALRVSNDKIVAIGPSQAFPDAVDLPGRAVIPGFVDAHTHIGQIFGKALIGGEPAQIWRRIWHPMEKNLTSEQSYITAKWAFWEALRGGFTKVVNYGLNGLERNIAVHRAAQETGIRLVSACGLDEFSDDIGTGDRTHTLPEIMEVIDTHIEQTRDIPRVEPSVCCSSFMGNTPQTLTALSEACAKRGILLQIHSNEHFPEVHECLLRFGK